MQHIANVFTASILYRSCGAWFGIASKCKRHEQRCERGPKYKYVGGPFRTPQNVFQKLESFGICIPEDLRWNRYRATFDLESYFEKSDRGTSRHIPMSASVASTVPGRYGPQCFISTGDTQAMIDAMLNWLLDTADEMAELQRRTFAPYIEQMTSLAARYAADRDCRRRAVVSYDDGDVSETDEDNSDIEQGNSCVAAKTRADRMLDEFIQFIECLPVIGFNSANYDIPLIKPYLARFLMGEDPNACIPVDSVGGNRQDGEATSGRDELLYCCQKGNSVTMLKTRRLTFTDVTKYLSPGTSYDRWITVVYLEKRKEPYFMHTSIYHSKS